MDFDEIRKIVKKSGPAGFDKGLAMKAGIGIFKCGDPVLLRNNEIMVEVSHDGVGNVDGVCVYGTTTYLKSDNCGDIVDEMARIARGGPVIRFASGRSSAQQGFIFRQDPGTVESDISNCISKIRELQNDMLGYMERYVPEVKYAKRVAIEDGLGSYVLTENGNRKKYTMHSPNNGVHGRSDAHYKMEVEYDGELMPLDAAISRFGDAKDGRSGSKTGDSWRKGTLIFNKISGLNLSEGTVKMRYYKNRDERMAS